MTSQFFIYHRYGPPLGAEIGLQYEEFKVFHQNLSKHSEVMDLQTNKQMNKLVKKITLKTENIIRECKS